MPTFTSFDSVEITSEGFNTTKAKVDGVELKNVTWIKFEERAGGLLTLTIECIIGARI